MLKRLTVAVLVSLVATSSFSQDGSVADPASMESAPVEPKKSSAGAVITITTLFTLGAGAAAFFIYRHARGERERADSITAIVEGLWDSAAVFYNAQQYRGAVDYLQKIPDHWREYEYYSSRYRKNRRIDPDSISAVIASCDFLERMLPVVTPMIEYAQTLPTEEEELPNTSLSRLRNVQNYLRRSIDSILTLHSNHRIALEYGFRPIEKRLRQTDSLLQATYNQRKRDFALKNRFYYNRAMESKDSDALRDFVYECDHFDVEKEWCSRARIALKGGNDSGVQKLPAPSAKRMTLRDSIRVELREALSSHRIEILEAYISKYSGRRYRAYRSVSDIAAAQAALRQLRLEISGKARFNSTWPRFSNPDAKLDIPINTKGISSTSEEAFGVAWQTMRKDIAQLPDIRLPAHLDIDYTIEPPVLLLDAAVSLQHDIEKSSINGRTSYRITCLLPAMKFLDDFKFRTVSMLRERKSSMEKFDEALDYQINKVESAMYMVRLKKAGDGAKGYIIFYARARVQKSVQDSAKPVEFYDFYDLSADGMTTKRCPIYPGSLPNIIPSLAADSLEQIMGEEFFGR